MGKTRIIAETGAGQHGVAAATVSARFGLPCVVYMGATDVERQKPNVFRMNACWAPTVNPVTVRQRHAQGRHERGAARLGDQRRGHLLPDRHGRRPAPLSGDGARLPVGHRRRDARADDGRRKAACRTRSSPASAAAPTPSACSIRSSTTRTSRSTASKPAATALEVENGHAASMSGGRPGVLHGNRTYLLQDADGQILEGHSISAGLDYPGVGPEHSWLKRHAAASPTCRRPTRRRSTRSSCLTRIEGIIPALEIRARPRLRRRSSRRRCGKDQTDRRQPLRPRRQGRVHRRQHLGMNI